MVLLRLPLQLMALGVLLVVSVCPGRSSVAARPRSRRAFAAAMGQVAASLQTVESPPDGEASGPPLGMSEPEVLALLGPPNDVVRYGDPQRFDNDPSVGEGERLLRYGVQGRARTATLGMVLLDSMGRARAVYGGKGRPPDPELVSERQLRRDLLLLDELPLGPLPMGATHDPRKWIQIINELQQLGRDRALAAIGEFGRVQYSPLTPEMLMDPEWEYSDRSALHGLTSQLFELPDDPRDRADPTAFFAWKWSVLRIREVPLMTTNGGGIGGSVAFGASALDHYRRFGKFLSRPLCPPERPWELVDELSGTPEWRAARPQERQTMRELAANQVLRMLDSVYPMEPNRLGELVASGAHFEDVWRAIVTDLERLDLRWDPEQYNYYREDGEAISPPDVRARGVYESKVSVGGVTVRIKAYRASDYGVSLRPSWSGPRLKEHLDDAVLRVYAGRERARAGVFRPPPNRQPRGGVQVREGVNLRLVLSVGEKEREGPTLRL